MALTKEQKQQAFAELGRFIEEIKDEKGSMMPIMQQAQKLFGCVSLEVQEFISQKTGASVAELYGIATFYAQFTLEPKGENAGETTKDGKFSIQDTRCLGCCGLAPVMVINEDVYGRLTPAEIKGILAKY